MVAVKAVIKFHTFSLIIAAGDLNTLIFTLIRGLTKIVWQTNEWLGLLNGRRDRVWPGAPLIGVSDRSFVSLASEKRSYNARMIVKPSVA